MLLAKLYVCVTKVADVRQVPEPALRHLQSAYVHSSKQVRDLRWEVKCLEKVAKQLGFPLILLKGSAYAMAGLDVAKGRIFSDIDLMVEKKNIGRAEKQLMINGWVSSNNDAYDQKYYRTWMHEIPPVRHVIRGSVLDVHHNILPDTAKNSPNAGLLVTDSRPLPGYEFISVLSPFDMIIHSATHLFYDGELEHGLRDLVDLDTLLRSNREAEGFEERLALRAHELGLQRPLFYAVRYSQLFLHTPISEAMLRRVESWAPSSHMLRLMDFLFVRALIPDHASCNDRWTGIARWILYIRSHWLRMPLYLLVPHLARKSFKRLRGTTNH